MIAMFYLVEEMLKALFTKPLENHSKLETLLLNTLLRICIMFYHSYLKYETNSRKLRGFHIIEKRCKEKRKVGVANKILEITFFLKMISELQQSFITTGF